MSAFPLRAELRLAAVAGWLSAAVLLVNAAKRAAILPTTPLTQLVAPLGQIFAIGLVLGLFALCRGQGGRFLRIGLAANLIALAGLVGAEFVINLVFSYSDTAEVDALLAGPLGIALTVVSILFILASLAFVAGLWRTGLAPRVPLAVYAVTAVLIGLRAFVPEPVFLLAIALLAVAVAWLAVTLWRREPEPA